MEKNNQKESKKVSKILGIIGNVIFALIIIFILIFAISNVRAKNNNGLANIFGRGYVSVLSDSMDGKKPEGVSGYEGFAKGDLIFVNTNKAKSKDLKAGDIATYWSANERKVISHRINKVFENADGSVTYSMLGDKYAVLEQYETISNTDVLGVYTGHKLSGAGTALAWMQSSVGFFVVVVLPTILFLLVELAMFVKSLMEYKTELAPASKQPEAVDKEALKKELLEELIKSGAIPGVQPQPSTPANEPVAQKETQENTSAEEK